MKLMRFIRSSSPLRLIVVIGTLGILVVMSATGGFLYLQERIRKDLHQKQECYFDLIEFRMRLLGSEAFSAMPVRSDSIAVTSREGNFIRFMLARLTGKMQAACLKHMPVFSAPAGDDPELLSIEIADAAESVHAESLEAADRLVLVNQLFLFFILAFLLTLSLTAGWLLHYNYRQTLIPLAVLANRLNGINSALPETIHDTAEEMKRDFLGASHSSDISRITASIMHFFDEIEAKNKKLDEINIRDEKTGLFNYRHFKEHLIAESERSKRFSVPVSMAMIDIDHFKLYNDAHGHIAGDAVLAILADIIASNCRGTDIPARFGGEEFAVLFPNTGSVKAFEIADRLRRTISEEPIAHEENQPGGQLTVSIGIATLPDDARDWYTLINNADRALYKAKTQGRDGVVCFASVSGLQEEGA